MSDVLNFDHKNLLASSMSVETFEFSRLLDTKLVIPRGGRRGAAVRYRGVHGQERERNGCGIGDGLSRERMGHMARQYYR